MLAALSSMFRTGTDRQAYDALPAQGVPAKTKLLTFDFWIGYN
jgi:hypothetical protein